jgi:hypothetical protein
MSGHPDPTATLLPDGPAARIEPVMGGGGLAFMGGNSGGAVRFANNVKGDEQIPAEETEDLLAEGVPANSKNEEKQPQANQKQDDEPAKEKKTVSFNADELKILSEHGLGPGGPISLDINEETKAAFLEQRRSKVCSKGTGDAIVMNNKCWAVVAVIRALLRHNIRSANSLPSVVGVEINTEEEVETDDTLKKEEEIVAVGESNQQPPIDDKAIHTLLETLVSHVTEGKPILKLKVEILKNLLKYPKGRSFVIHRILKQVPEVLEAKEKAVLDGLKENIQRAKESLAVSA